MERRLSAKRMISILNEMKEISRMDFMLFSEKGKFIVGTTELTESDIRYSVEQFSRSLAESQVVQKWIFLRVEPEDKLEYILLCSQTSGMENDYIIGKMAACQIRNLCLSTKESVDKIHFLRNLMNGEVTQDKIDGELHRLHLKNERFMLYVIQFSKEKDTVILETLKNLFVVNTADYLVEMDNTKVVLVKNTGGIEQEDYEQYANVIVDNLQTEAMTNVWIGYGDAVDSFGKMAEAYRNACTALKIGRIFYEGENVFWYSRLGIGRLIYQLPIDLCEMFLKEVFGEKKDVSFDEETLITITQLFDNNLNISETARQLYIHRNTLVYRLERIEKKLGLDIRSFEDAMLFKIAMMVRTHVNVMKRKKS